ncbi:potassium-transporting ATPase subunit KdpB [Pseudomonas sp. 6D_7.1_Bac1]|uniref:potassium-transporting ATPase subunit KdpB n=1 Tax=Pseudomonas sp. 6D_7.1_Bac1 TaxID=2971615 RepID=UPI0021C81362|nr:potassium-transporting ATPase subunit KdpB [Pseudomonas sp. 6D_7.1_Bac1]MCU1749113.1 potassium-transporting ATPase subunit KdpB [Pseudomonas sp. 6D_7.1_Bac1]
MKAQKALLLNPRLTSTVRKGQRHGYNAELLKLILVEPLKKLDPRLQIKNPVMFVVWLGTLVTAALTVNPQLFGPSHASSLYNGVVTFILFITVWFANLAEAMAEGRGKAKAASLRHTTSELNALRLLDNGKTETVPAAALRKGDLVRVNRDELVPTDGEVVEGVAYVDESMITGESAPVVKEPGSEVASTVTGGTRVISDSLVILVTASPGHTFLDRMISLVEGAKRQKTPNEIALTVLLSVLTLIFVIVVTAIAPVAAYLNAQINVADLVALIVALIPTTIGALLSAIGIAGIDRTMRFNMLAMSGKAVEAAGDVNTLLLDKTGTITMGNRQATEFLPVSGCSRHELMQASYLASLFDTTPEGKSTIAFATAQGAHSEARQEEAVGTDFSAQTRMSGTDMGDGRVIRKGAVDSVVSYVKEKYGTPTPADLRRIAESVSKLGATPLAVAVNGRILGIITLSDVLKPGIRERAAELRAMGIRTVMVTGDNPTTASVIAAEAGLDTFVAQATPEDKLKLIRSEQAQGHLVAMTGDGTNDAPALAQADVGLAMYTGTMPAKEAANIIDLDSDPTKLLDLVSIGKRMLITRGALTTFSIANDVAKYFAILPALFMVALPGLAVLNVMHLATPQSAILSALIFNALIIPALIPLALRGVKFMPKSAESMFYRNLMVYGVGGLVAPFIGIKLIDLCLTPFL